LDQDTVNRLVYGLYIRIDTRAYARSSASAQHEDKKNAAYKPYKQHVQEMDTLYGDAESDSAVSGSFRLPAPI